MPDLSDLEGMWSMRRAIRHADGTAARLVGTATWRDDGAGLLCAEAGRLRIAGGATLSAARVTLFRDAPDGIEVQFADGRAFHRIGAGGSALHDCPPDTYRLAYDFTAWPHWSVVWRVTGPRKDYVARTRYAPA